MTRGILGCGLVLCLIGCEDATSPAPVTTAVANRPDETASDPNRTVDLRLTLRRDGRAMDLKRESLSITWHPDSESDDERAIKAGLGHRLALEGSQARGKFAPEPGRVVINRILDAGADATKPPFRWKCEFRPQWPASSDVLQIELNLLADALSFDLATMEGKAVKRVRAHLNREAQESLPAGVESLSLYAYAFVGDDSRCAFGDVPEGTYRITVDAEIDRRMACYRTESLNFLSVDGRVEIHAEGPTWRRRPFVHELNRKLTVKVAQGGRGVPDVAVRVDHEWWQIPGEQSDNSRATYELSGKTDTDGVWTVQVPDGRARLVVTSPEFGNLECYAQMDGNAPNRAVSCTLPNDGGAASVTGRIEGFGDLPRSSDGYAIDWMVALARDGDPAEDPRPLFTTTRLLAVDKDGGFEAENILPGIYRLSSAPSLKGEARDDVGDVFAKLLSAHGRSERVPLKAGSQAHFVLLRE